MIDLKKEQDTPPEDGEASEDYWTRFGDYWIRVHEKPRTTYFHPEDPDGQPRPFLLAASQNVDRKNMVPNSGTKTRSGGEEAGHATTSRSTSPTQGHYGCGWC